MWSFRPFLPPEFAQDVVQPLSRLFGPSGCGRSTFINSLLPPDAKRRPKAQGGLDSVTESCELFVVESGPFRRNSDYRKLPGRLVLIDTPGFQNSNATDEKVAQDISTCLQSLFSQRKVWVAGAIVMASIETDRVRPIRSDSLSDRLSSESTPPIAIVTTHWDVLPDHAQGRRKEGILRRSLWARAPENALMFRFYNTSNSAWKAMDGIVHEFVSLSDMNRVRDEKKRSGSFIGRLIHFIVGLVNKQLPGGTRDR